MRLSDVVGGAHLSGFTQLALLLLLLAFVLLLLQLFVVRRSPGRWKQLAEIPLDDPPGASGGNAR